MSAAHNYSHYWGEPLTESDYRSLAARWIPRELADQCGIRRVDSITGGEMFRRETDGAATAGAAEGQRRKGRKHRFAESGTAFPFCKARTVRPAAE